MRYFIDDTPKIKLKYSSKDWIKILIFIAIYFSPVLMRVIDVKSKNSLKVIEVLYYVAALLATEFVI